MRRTTPQDLPRVQALLSGLVLAGLCLTACEKPSPPEPAPHVASAPSVPSVPSASGQESAETKPAAADGEREQVAQSQGMTWTQAKLEATSREIQKDVEELRGARFEADVPVKLSSKAQFQAYAIERTERMEPEAKRTNDEMILKMLGLIPADMDLMEETMRLLTDQVGGFYDPGTKSFYLMENCPEGLAKVVLAHELGHALDDQLYDLDGTLKKVAERGDVATAYMAVVEGSGTAVMNRWTVDNRRALDLKGITAMQEEQNESLARSPMILWKPLIAAYMKGAAFLARTESVLMGAARMPSNADIDQAFRFPPTSTEQILHPSKYWEGEERDEPIVVEQQFSDLPEGWQVLRRDVVGELAMGVWTISPAERARFDASKFASATEILGLDYTTASSRGWGGDELVLLGKDSGARGLRWVTVWDTERDAAEFLGTATALVPELEAPLGQLSKLAGGEARHRTVSVRYGTEKEVIVELSFGAKPSEIKRLFRAFEDR